MTAPANDATTALLRGLSANFGNFHVTMEEIKSRSWASATFTGARHEIGFLVLGEGAEAAATHFADGLAAREFALRGHIVADIAALSVEPTEGGARIRIEALTVEDA